MRPAYAGRAAPGDGPSHFPPSAPRSRGAEQDHGTTAARGPPSLSWAKPLLGAAAGEAGGRQRPRALALRLALRGRLVGSRLRHDRLVRAEDVGLGLALEQPDELVAFDRLAAEQDVRRVVEL